MISVIGTTLGIIIAFPLHALAIELGCENCGCCKDGLCGEGFVNGRKFSEGYCIHGCVPGIGGNKCYNKCPTNCLTCNQTYPTLCESCADGKYLGPTIKQWNEPKLIRDCSKNCSSKCKKCTSLTKCQECFPPYFNDDITTNCSLTCPRNCLCENVGICSSCKQGYYNTTNRCRDVCPGTCLTCTDLSHCQSCRPLYSGDMCCVKDGYCKKCSSRTTCEKCAIGYYGETCNMSCPGTCQKMSQETQCKKDSGSCLSCDVGLYGDYCTMNCSERCLNHMCQKDTGDCTDGCVAGFEGPTCAEKKCPDNVVDTENDNGKVIGIASAVFVTIFLIMIILAVLAMRKWKENYQRMNQDNRIIYVNTQSQPTSMDKDDVHSDRKGQFEYETLEERNTTYCDEYDQIKSVT